MRFHLKIIRTLLTQDEKRDIGILLAAVLLMGILETTGIASIMPLMSVLADPDIIHQNRYLAQLYAVTNFSDEKSFLIFLGLAALTILICSNAFSAFTTRLQLRFIYRCGHSISKRLFGKYLSQPYTYYLSRNTSDFTKNIVTEVHRIIVGSFTPTLQIISRCIITLCILTLLIIVDPLLALLVFFTCGSLYLGVFWLVRRQLTKRGKISAAAQASRFKLVSEAFGGIKEIKLANKESEHLRRFDTHSHAFAMSEAAGQSIMLLPKYALETVVFGGILVILLYLINAKDGLGQVLPLMGVYAFAGYRLMPAFQQIFSGVTLIRYHRAILDIIYRDLTAPSDPSPVPITATPKEEALAFSKRLEVANAYYRYPGSEVDVLKDINLNIPANTTIGLAGATGSGKTTLVDIILGLLPLTSGKLLVDGEELGPGNMSQWQKMIGYVPQKIYLSDDTLAMNIAFGLPAEIIDPERMVQAAKIAQIHRFIQNELDAGYDSIAGERGVKLSGGQCQRIGLARALYNDPPILVLDEATSALDGQTERQVMAALQTVSGQKTIIMIAHRLSTLRNCDTILLLENGRIIDRGTFTYLYAHSKRFRELEGQD